MHTLDGETTKWRRRPEWSFKTIKTSDIVGYQRKNFHLPDFVQIHGDVWMAYEWNYHRTARILLHLQLLTCLTAIESDDAEFLEEETAEVMAWRDTSTFIVRALAEEVLSTVAQTFGDVDNLGRSTAGVYGADAPRCQAIGAYLMLWPAKIIKSEESVATAGQKKAARGVFERIRECTGMKRSLGSLSII